MCKLRIRDLREDEKISQKEIADLLKTTQQQISKYENEIQEIPVRHIKTLAKYYNISSDYLLGLINEPRPLYGRRI